MCHGGPRRLRAYGDLRLLARPEEPNSAPCAGAARTLPMPRRCLGFGRRAAGGFAGGRRRDLGVRGNAVPFRRLVMNRRYTVETLDRSAFIGCRPAVVVHGSAALARRSAR